MGLNTIHNKSKDLMMLFNVTQNKWFKAELMQSDNQRDYQTANGLDFLKIKHELEKMAMAIDSLNLWIDHTIATGKIDKKLLKD
jgi:hypothetical protein